jgi:hypothetical protein
MPAVHVLPGPAMQRPAARRERLNHGKSLPLACSLPSRVAARCEKMSRMRAVRSHSRTDSPSAFSRLRSWPAGMGAAAGVVEAQGRQAAGPPRARCCTTAAQHIQPFRLAMEGKGQHRERCAAIA